MKRTVAFNPFLRTLPVVTLWILCLTTACEKSPQPSPNAQMGFKVYERWREGGDKLRSRKWVKNDDHYRENCYVDPDGKQLGCGIVKNGKNWDGFFLKWQAYNKPSDSGRPYYGKPAEISHFRHGLLHGTYRKFYPNGSPMREIEYKDGEQARWKGFSPGGKLYHEGKRPETPKKDEASPPEWK